MSTHQSMSCFLQRIARFTRLEQLGFSRYTIHPNFVLSINIDSMRSLIICFFLFSAAVCFAQGPETRVLKNGSLVIIKKDPVKGFYSDYILFIPKKTAIDKKTFLLVEPNNTGKLSDSTEVHEEAAIRQASVSSIGNNIATELNIPLLVPAFPRPAAEPLLYSHALDRDVMTKKSGLYKRIDLQLLAMIEDAKKRLQEMNILVHEKVFMNGFSASGTFTNRFSLLHPGTIQALAIGGFNGKLMLPQNRLNNAKLNYPIGTNDFEKLFKKPFDLKTYQGIPQYIYLGKLDDNDAVQFDDGYSDKERKIINENLAPTVQERFLKCQELYLKNNINPIFVRFDNVGHWTDSFINLEVIKFFQRQIKAAQ